MSEPFIAEIRIFAGNFAPRGWAFCGGQLLPIDQNTALFSLVGTTYGGDGRTTLGLPNLEGRSPMHPGRGPGLTSYRLGQKAGTETVTLSEAQVPPHTHDVAGSISSFTTLNPVGSAWGTFQLGNYYRKGDAGGPNVDMHADALAKAGGNPTQAHNNDQPYLAMYYIIALQGVYPSRS